MLVLENIVAGYGKMTILNNMTFTLAPGKITTVIGPNGAGKSTMFKTAFGLLKPRNGTMRLDGKDVTGCSPRHMLEAGVTYVPQGRNLFPMMTVLENLELGAVSLSDQGQTKDRMEEMLERFPILRQKAGRQAGTLSGGQQKILEIARALLLSPRLMLIDEPSIGLSPMLVAETFETLQNLRDNGMTILLIEQNAKHALAMSDDGMVFEQGQCRMHERASDLLDNPQVAQLFLGGHANV